MEIMKYLVSNLAAEGLSVRNFIVNSFSKTKNVSGQ